MKGSLQYTYAGNQYQFVPCKNCGEAPTVIRTPTVQWGNQFTARCIACQSYPIPLAAETPKDLMAKWNGRESAV